MSRGERKDREPAEQLRRLQKSLADREADLRSAQQALDQNRQWLSFAIDAAQVLAWEWNLADQQIQRYGDPEAVWGIPASFFTDHPDGLIPCVHPDDREAVIATMRQGAGGGGELEFRVISPADGSERWVADRHRVMLDAERKPRLIYGICMDVTLRKRWEQQLQQINATLEEVAAERGVLADERLIQLRQLAMELSEAEQSERRRLAQVLHDHMQQMMVAAKLHIEQMARRAAQAPDAERLRHIAMLLNQCVENARTLAVDLNPPVLTDSGLAAALHWLAQRMLEHHEFTVHVDADAADNPDSATVAAFLFQSVRELLLNALKHSGRQEAQVRMCALGDQIEVTVHDEGEGFDTLAAGGPRGSNFGLFSIRERLNLLGGGFELISAPGKGTSVRITAPRREPPPVPPPKAPPLVTAAPVAEARPRPAGERSVKVMLVDDHPMVRDGLAEVIRREPDMEVVGAAAEGQSAVELTDLLEPDVIVMDVNMPVMNGMEATRHISRRHPRIRVIGISLHDDPEIAQRMRDAGASGYLCKTADPSALIQSIRAAIEMQ